MRLDQHVVSDETLTVEGLEDADCVLDLCLNGISDDDLACERLRRAMEDGNSRLADELVTGRKMRSHLAKVLSERVSSDFPLLPIEVWQIVAEMCIHTARPSPIKQRAFGKRFQSHASIPTLAFEPAATPNTIVTLADTPRESTLWCPITPKTTRTLGGLSPSFATSTGGSVIWDPASCRSTTTVGLPSPFSDEKVEALTDEDIDQRLWLPDFT